MVSLLHRKRHDVAAKTDASSRDELARLLEEQTGDPAFMERTSWVTAFGKHDYETALEEVDRALVISHDAAIYRALRAMTYYELGRYGEAQADVADALTKEPALKEALDMQAALHAEAQVRRNKARELGRGGDDAAAIRELTTAVELEPERAENHFMRGLFHAHANETAAAVADVTRALELDPGYPDAQSTLDALERMAEAPEQTTEPWHFYICSGNPSLIDTFTDLFREAGKGGNITYRRCFASNADLAACKEKASDGHVAFGGTKQMGKNAEPVEGLDSVLTSMAFQGSTGVHVASVTVDASAKEWVATAYNEFLDQAVQQGIMPFPMFATPNEEAARVLDDVLMTR